MYFGETVIALCRWVIYEIIDTITMKPNGARLQGLQVGTLINNVIVVCSCVLGEGWEASGIDQHLCVYCETLHYLCMCVIVHAYCITDHNLPSFFSSIQWDPDSFSPPGLSCPAVHSCEKQREAERDICSLRECPNYSWSFNHSGFGLCSICGVSHKCVSATLVNASFITVVFNSVPPNHLKAIILYCRPVDCNFN